MRYQLRHGPAVAVALVGSALATGLPASSGVSSPCMCALLCNEVRGTVHGLRGNRTDQVTVHTSLVLASPLAGGWHGLRISRRFDVAVMPTGVALLPRLVQRTQSRLESGGDLVQGWGDGRWVSGLEQFLHAST